MKKLILILIAFSFSGYELNAQIAGGGSGLIFRSTGADRGGNTGQSTNFGPMGDWSVDLVVSEKDPNLAASQFIGPCLLYTSPSPRDGLLSRMPSSA